MSSEDTFNKEAAQTIITFLKTNVPKSDVPNVEQELKTELVLSKRKGKNLRKKPKRKKKQLLTRKEKKKLGFYNISRNSIKYEDFVAMHHIWKGYMKELLELDKPGVAQIETVKKNMENFTQSVFRADFHGSLLHVVRSKCPSYVGKIGICIMDTKNTFKIVSKDNLVTTIPKKESVFEMCIDNLKLTLFGKHLCVRPAERSTKKVKGHFFPDL